MAEGAAAEGRMRLAGRANEVAGSTAVVGACAAAVVGACAAAGGERGACGRGLFMGCFMGMPNMAPAVIRGAA